MPLDRRHSGDPHSGEYLDRRHSGDSLGRRHSGDPSAVTVVTLTVVTPSAVVTVVIPQPSQW